MIQRLPGRPPSRPASLAEAVDDAQLRPLLLQARAGDLEARNAVVTRLRGWVTSLAHRSRLPLDPDDLIQSGLIAVDWAIDRWDPERGIAFVAYASRRVCGSFRDLARGSSLLWRTRRHGGQPRCLSLEEQAAGESESFLLRAAGASPEEQAAAERELAEWIDRHFARPANVILRGRILRGWTMRECGRAVGLSESRISKALPDLLARARKLLLGEGRGVPAEIPLVESGIDPRTVAILEGVGLLTLGEVAARAREELAEVPLLGEVSIGWIERRLEELGLRLADRPDPDLRPLRAQTPRLPAEPAPIPKPSTGAAPAAGSWLPTPPRHRNHQTLAERIPTGESLRREARPPAHQPLPELDVAAPAEELAEPDIAADCLAQKREPAAEVVQTPRSAAGRETLAFPAKPTGSVLPGEPAGASSRGGYDPERAIVAPTRGDLAHLRRRLRQLRAEREELDRLIGVAERVCRFC